MHVGKALAIAGGTAVGTVLGTAVAVNTIASLSRRRHQPQGFPYDEPMTTVVAGTEVTVYTYGAHLYEAMLEAIEQAHDRIYLETFIWKSDAMGQRFKDACVAAADRGVRVCLIWDVFANIVVPRDFFHFPSTVEIYPYPLLKGGVFFLGPRHSGRDHRKVMVVDGKVGFMGGYNIGSLYENKWRDTHARIVGPLVADLEGTFVRMWNRGAGRPRSPLPQPVTSSWDPRLMLHNNVPQIMTYPIRNMYLEAIRRAQRRIWLTHAYFIPDKDMTRALLDAVARGVDVRLIIPHESNHVLADWLARHHYDELLTGGMQLFLYEDAMIHSKTAVIDSVWSTIGTANLDQLSLLGNYEINLEAYSTRLAAVMEHIFETDLTNCTPLSINDWRRRPFYAQVSEQILAPTRPFL